MNKIRTAALEFLAGELEVSERVFRRHETDFLVTLCERLGGQRWRIGRRRARRANINLATDGVSE